jgi:hypothetical protein
MARRRMTVLRMTARRVKRSMYPGRLAARTAFVLKQVRLEVGSQVLSRGAVKKPNKKKKKKNN